MLQSSKSFPGVYTSVAPELPSSTAAKAVIIPFGPPSPVVPSGDVLAGLDLFGFQSFGPMGITVLTFNTVSSIAGFDLEADPVLLELHFPNLVSIDPTHIQFGYLQVLQNPNLTVLDLPVFVPNPGDSFNLAQNAFDAASVNNFLRRCVLNAAFGSGSSINISGGTSAAPTGQGITDKATLVGRGVIVNTN